MEFGESSEVVVRDLRKSFGSQVAVDGIDLVAENGKVTTLLGPSGCGKTTTLRCIAGLERPDRGRISIGDETVTDPDEGVFVPPHERDLGFVFQRFDVWPNMTVFENVAYPLQVRGDDAAEIRTRVERVLELAGIDHLADEPAPSLSGGQQARVSLCRSIVYEPQVLLFDEPLSGLDRNRRRDLLTELTRIQRETGLTAIYVTHSQREAMIVSDTVCLLNDDGRIEQAGDPRQVYERPASRFAFEFLGETVTLEGTYEDGAAETVLGRVRSENVLADGDSMADGGNDGPAASGCDGDPVASGRDVSACFRIQDAELSTVPENAAANAWRGELEGIDYAGGSYEFVVGVDGRRLRVRRRDPVPGLEPGDDVTVFVDPSRTYLFPR